MLTLTINGNDRSAWVEWPSLNWEPAITKEPDLLSFAIKVKPGRTIPELGESVVLAVDGNDEFSGTITERRQKNIGGLLQIFEFRAKDAQFDLDKKLVAKAYSGQTGNAILTDIFNTFTDGTFTLNNVQAGLATITSIKFNYEPVSKCIQRIADLLNMDWYIDADKDLHFFEAALNAAPFEIDDTAGKLNFETLEFNRNILELKNYIIIAGGDYQKTYTASDTPDVYSADGTQRIFTNIYRYSSVEVTVNAAAKTVGIDGIHNEADYDVLYNFQEKAIKFRENNKPTAGQTVKVFGNAYVPLLTQIIDGDSIDTYGERQTLYKNEKITTINEAFTAGKAELAKWSAGSYEGKFTTNQGGLRPGQQIRINSTKYGVSKYFKINKVSATARTPDALQYNVQFIASGSIKFTDMMVGLLGNAQSFDLTDNTVIRRLNLIRETLQAVESVSATKTSPPYKWGTGSSNDLRWGFGTWS
jgi:hypothetical protein